MRASLGVVILLVPVTLGLAPAPHARADVVGPPPASCPTGAVGDVCHGSSYCRPTTCTIDSDCTGGLVCRAQGLCLGSVSCVGRLAPDSAPPPPRDTADRTCSGGEACGAETCVVALRCVPPSSTPSFSGCDCRAARAAEHDPAAELAFAGGLLALAAACVLRGRGRRRRGAGVHVTLRP